MTQNFRNGKTAIITLLSDAAAGYMTKPIKQKST
jgi:hypothetical protein